MFNCSNEIIDFHNESVILPTGARKQLRENRKANEDRLKDGLKAASQPAPIKFVQQGSYAMHTTIKQPNNDYDIDDGVLFLKDDLKGAQGADKSPLDARQMVCDALQDKAFNKKPKITTNCVRVFYNQGHHVDIPVYRVVNPDSASTTYEIASSEWKIANPEGVTKWFEDCVTRHNGETDDSQLRRMVRLLKAFAVSRPSWNMPSGFILTVLINESYQSDGRDDVAFHSLLSKIKIRLAGNLVVRHPVVSEDLTKSSEDANIKELLERIDWALSKLQVTLDYNCTKKQALKAWREVFDTDFFDTLIESEAALRSPHAITNSTPTSPVDKKGANRFG